MNIGLHGLNGTAVTARAAEVPNADFAGGANLGSCNQGLGIATAVINTSAEAFSQIADTAAHPTQHIGGDGLGDGDATNFAIEAVQGADVNDTIAFVQSDSAAADGAVCDVATGAVNETGQTLAIGDWVWGVIPVA